MLIHRRGLLVAAALALPGVARAQSWPTRPIRFIIPFAPGGPVEVPGRFLADRLSQTLGQPVLVETRPGAGGALGIQNVVQSNDGHTFLFTTSSVVILPALMRDPGYDPFRDLVPISQITDAPMAFVARADWPVRDLTDFLAQARANPGRFSYGSSGAGSTTHLGGELLKVRAGIDILHVPYRGAGQAVNALYAGDTDLLVTGLIETQRHVREGRLRAIGVTSPRRSPVLPEVPAIAEQVPGYEISIWYAMFGPRGTPPEVVDLLARELTTQRTGSRLAEQMTASGTELLLDGPGPLAARVAREVPQWKELVRTAGISLE
ncbi:Bug family tripartite tricarboxylate transporter substrate binding protein [Falsiroseomonas sp. HW251]|uniref:Bug family tripartite tricarboxylate transporter substrate binding protein n=1 Tax=Falsiroseomonas sp. HW251 TaxID=3390998 RepID=UPI003D311C2E